MKLPDDRLPEEQDPQYEELITLLQHANLNPMLVDPTERAQLLARARARLFQTDPEASTPEDMPVLEVSELASFPGKPKALADKQHRGRRLIRLVNELAAVLVVIALIGSALLLFWHRLPSTDDRPRQLPTAPPIGPVGTPVTVHAQAGGLEMTMRITPGPYFLSEMLVADLSLANRSQTTYLLQGTWDNPGTPYNDLCQAPLKIVVAGGESPYDTKLQHDLAAFACNSSPETGTFQLPAGHTITVRQYIAITSSGHLTLTARATFQKVALGQDGTVHVFPATGPLDGHWPTLHVFVQTQIPSDRLISLQPQASQVIVDTPPAARGQLLYLSVYTCLSGGGGSEAWTALQTMTIQKPQQCGGFSVRNGTPTPDRLVRWAYVVGAPGYALASGTYPS